MDDSFKKLNGPSANGIQSDYLAKEKRAAEELLNLQLGNAKKLADLRSKLLSKLMDEAKEEGKLVEDYLAEYGLQKRLDALATELDAEKKARVGQLDELQAIRQENADALAATEEKVAKLRATQQAKEAAARKAANQAQHKAELAALKELEKARKNLTVPSANVEVSVDPIEPIDVQARVETELDIDSTGLENLSAEAVVTPEVSEITLPQTELEVTPQISDINLPPVESVTPSIDLPSSHDLTVKAKVEFDPELPTGLDIVAHISAEDPTVGPISVDANINPQLTNLPNIPEFNSQLNLAPIVQPIPELTTDIKIKPVVNPVEDQVANLKLTTIVDQIQDQEVNAILNPDTSALEGLETVVAAKVETDGSTIESSFSVEAEAGLAQSRLAGVQQAYAKEADLIAFRQKSEEELNARRISSLDLLQDTFHNLYSLIPTEIRGPEGPIEIPTDTFNDFSLELENVFNRIQNLLSEAFSLPADIPSTALPGQDNEKSTGTSSPKGQSAVDISPRLNTATVQFAKLRAEIDNSFGPEKIAPLFETLSVKIEEADQKVKATNEALAKALEEGDKQAILSARTEKELAEKTALEIYSSATALAKRLDDANKSKAVREADIQRAAQDERAIIALTHDADMHKLHIEAVRARYQAENELYRLSLITEADIAQQYEDEKAKKSEDARTALEKKKQELARANLAADDEKYLKEEALAELEATRVDKEIKAANARIEKQKQQIKYEQSLIAIRLEGLKNNDKVPDEYKDLVADPAALQFEIEKRLAQVNPEALQTVYKEQGLTEADQAEAETKAVEAAKAEAEANGTTFDEEAVRAQVADKFRLDRELAAKALAEDQAGLEELFALRTAQEEAIQGAKDDAAKKARKEAEKEDEKGFKAWTKKFIELNKRKGKLGQLAGAAADLGSFASGSIKGDIEARKAELEAEGKSEEEIKETLQKETQAKLDGALDAVGDFINQLATIGKSSTKHQSGVDTRLQGLTTDEGKYGVKKLAGSYWRSLSADIGKLGVSPFFLQETAEERFANLISQGIAFNVKERAFLDVLKDKVATTFNVADGTLVKLVRIQQADTSAARLGMESALTEFLNSMYATTEYMQQAAESIRANIYEATALMGAKEATEFEFQVQKWMGSLYSVGFSNAEGIATALGKIVAGEIEGITEGNMGNLLVMAANEAGKPIATILEKGLSAADTDDLLRSMVEYLAKLYDETKGSRVLSQQFANVFGLTASDLKAAASLASSLDAISGHDETFDSMLKQVKDMTGSLVARTSMGEMMENMKANFMYSMGASLANDPVSSSLNLVANLLNDLIGGIEIPFINVYGFGFDLNATVADLMNVAALTGPILGGVGKMIAGLANLNPNNLLKTFGVEQGDAGLNVQTRGSTAALVGGTLSGSGQSESGFVGNENSNDIKDKTVSDASAGPESTVAEAKEEQESKEEARSQMIASHIVDIYELLQEVTQGAKKFHVQLDVGSNPLSWAGGTWS